MANKFYSEKTFDLGDGLSIHCATQDTRYGFRHVASLRRDGFLLRSVKACYYNRTWEAWPYQSVVRDLVYKSQAVKEADAAMTRLDAEVTRETNSRFGLIANVAKLGSLLTDNPQESVDWKTRILQAGLPEMTLPDDWDQLDAAAKEARLDAAIAMLQKEL